MQKTPSTSNYKSCRICLQAQVQETHFITPCKCSGSLKYVHHQCLLIWLNTQLIRNKNKENTRDIDTCQICKQPFETSAQTKYAATSCQELQDEIKRNLFVFTFSVITIIGSIGCIGFLCDQIKNKQIQRYNVSDYDKIMIVGVCILIALSMGLIVKFIYFFMIKKKTKYVRVINKDKNQGCDNIQHSGNNLRRKSINNWITENQ